MDPLYAELLAEHWLQITFMHLVMCFFAGMVGYWLSSWLHDLADWLARRFLEKAVALPPRSAPQVVSADRLDDVTFWEFSEEVDHQRRMAR